MAIDTATKRASVVNIGLPWTAALPQPDGSVDSADRATLANAYAGFGTEGGGGGGGSAAIQFFSIVTQYGTYSIQIGA